MYPLGFTGAEPVALAPDERVRHRLRQLEAWLGYAVDLGCTGLLLGPVFVSETHGYDTVDHFEIDPRLGDQEDFDHLVAEAGRRGLRIVLDGVFNHVGRSFPAFQAALAGGPGSPAARWFRYDAGTGEYATFEGRHGLVTLDHEEPEVVDYVAQVMSYWLDRGAAGWRLDAAYAVPASFWAKVLPGVREAYPGAWFLGEMIHGDYAAYAADSGLDSITQYELWKAIWSSLNDPNFFELAWALGRHNEIRPAFPASPADLPPDGWPAYRLHQRLIGFRRRHPWLARARTTVEHLANETIAIRAAAQDAGILVLLNAGDAPFRFPVGVTGLTAAQTPDPDSLPADPALVPAHSWIILD